MVDHYWVCGVEEGFSIWRISANFIVKKICFRKESQLTDSFSWSLWVLMYCHKAEMMTGLVWVCTPSSLASLWSSLNCK